MSGPAETGPQPCVGGELDDSSSCEGPDVMVPPPRWRVTIRHERPASHHSAPGEAGPYASDRGTVSGRRCEELQRDVVRIPEGKSRTITCIDNSTVLYSQFVQPVLPLFKRSPIGTRECHVV